MNAHTEALEAALQLAQQGLNRFQSDVDDYTATLVKRERVDGTLGEPQTMFCKIRNRKLANGRLVVPLSIYIKALEPSDARGREVIWVEGRNSGNLIAHDTGLSGLVRVELARDHFLAMRGNRYPIDQLGIENLLKKAVERGERDRNNPDRELYIDFHAEVDGRRCTALEVRRTGVVPAGEPSRARFWIDNEWLFPVRYVAYGPATTGGESLLEEYTYRNLKLNVGLTDADFNPDHVEYAFP